MMRRPARSAPAVRIDGYAPIREYAVIGDGRTVALVARDGSIDWLCLPNIDSPSVFARLLDAKRGGVFELAPDLPFEVERRYIPHTNVLETTFFTAAGVARVIDAMTLPDSGLTPFRELARRVEGVAGCVPFRWCVEPRFGYGRWRSRIETHAAIPVMLAHAEALALRSWNAGQATCTASTISGRFETRTGSRSLLALIASHQEPLVFPHREAVETRFDRTIAFWQGWLGEPYAGPWAEAVQRSALALKLLVYAPSGAVAAAATTSLPEVIGGERNWDYRFCWIRDASFTLNALLNLGCKAEADAFFWWFMQATQLTHPRIGVLYRMDGGAEAVEHELVLDGYRGARPVRVGNAAVEQLQLDIYGVFLQTAWSYARNGHMTDRETGRRLAKMADLVCRIWRQPDAGIWEVRCAPRHFTHSKLMCWVALDRAIRLGEVGHLPGRHLAFWQAQKRAIEDFIENACWSDACRSYVRSADSQELDASLLLMAMMGYGHSNSPRFRSTVSAIRRGLGQGAFIRRYSGDDGLQGTEGYFLTCSFWLVQALTLAGQYDEAARLMDDLTACANDVGLYAEEIDSESGAMLGNFPQGLVHLALINAALAFKRI